MTLYALRPDPVTGSLDDAEVVDEFKYGWQFLEQAITLWRLVDKDRADQIKAIKDRAALSAPEESRFYPEDLVELVEDVPSDFSDGMIPKGTRGTVVERYEPPKEGYSVDMAIPDDALVGRFRYENVVLLPEQFIVQSAGQFRQDPD